MQKQKVFLGIDIGSTNAKVCAVDEHGRTVASGICPHHGEPSQAVSSVLEEIRGALSGKSIKGTTTGTEGRKRITLPEVIAAEAVEKALSALCLSPLAVVSMGGEDLVVYPIRDGKIQGTIAGNKCASGTGEFFRQQLGRMDMTLDDLAQLSGEEKVLPLSCRCSVFMKSDCTHRLNKGEASPKDIALSLCKVMADKVSEFFIKARIETGEVALIGGITKNRFIVNFLRVAWPNISFVIPEQAPYFEAFGAALCAMEAGAKVPHGAALFTGTDADAYKRYEPLTHSDDRVTYAPSRRGVYSSDAEYILGVDGGSTTTKAALIRTDTLEIVAEHYGRTHGDPVRALKLCVEKIKEQIGKDSAPKITLVSTTGSSRELLGVFLETDGVYNEIIAHAVGTSFFDSEVDTIFEIGGQDAKYVRLVNGVPIDYAMNEACSAGTGSFIEESARGDLNIGDVTEIGGIALKASSPLKFGEHCSAFINSDIRKAIQLGATKEDTAAGIIFSIVANYLNRVVGNRVVGKRIALQGGVAKNPAVPLAFAEETGRPILVPPDPELMGCFGVGLLAKKKCDEGLLSKGSFSLDDMLSKSITVAGEFTCKACDNLCPIRRLEVSGKKYSFGGRCSKYAAAKRRKQKDVETVDYTEVRATMIEDFCPKPSDLSQRTDKVVGIPRAFSFHSLRPFYSWYFHLLGVPTVTSDAISKKGIAKVESSYCFPAEIAHGAVENVLEKNVDYVFLPHFANMPSMEENVPHGTLCPLTQGLPYFVKKAFKLEDDKVLRPIVDFKHGFEESRVEFERMALKLGFTAEEGGAAYNKALEKFQDFLKAYKTKGEEVLAEIKADPSRPYVALFGRPYNAFTKDANMGIPRKFTSSGITIVPFDMIYDEDSTIFPNMYWYYGQQDMKAVSRIIEIPNLYLCWVSNFSCAPDSFMLHYIRWMLGRKPYLVLEIDSHTADAGLDTRVEAFLDVVESFRRAKLDMGSGQAPRRFQIERKKEFLDIVDTKTGERIDIRDKRVKTIFSSMGDLTTELIAAAAEQSGLNAVFLPVPDYTTAQVARASASGKECIPSLLVLGGILQYVQSHPPNQPDEYHVFFVPSTTGPCRTGQYFVFYERLLEEMGYDNVIIITGESDNSYREVGPTFNRLAWWSLELADYFTDVRLGIDLLARDPVQGQEVFRHHWRKIVEAMRTDINAMESAVENAGRAFASIPRKRTLLDVRKVLIVGEIFVRRDTFSVKEVTDYLVSQGIFPKVTDVTEWIRYTDHTRKTALNGAQKRKGFFRSLTSGVLKEKGIYHIEQLYKDMVEHKISRHILPTGLIVRAPHDMNEIMHNAETHFIDQALESEATVSSGVAATAMLDGFDGVVIIAPFACLPGRLLEGVYSPWARERGFPVLTLENDAQPYPPSTVARIEIFAHNVQRFEKQN
jgi:predicted CoA-substrate-specific enzyme activase